jgi:hypothetical protein
LKTGWISYPLTFAAFPILFLYSHNASLFPIRDLWIPLAAVILLVSILWWVLGLLVRSRERAALASAVLVLATFSYGPAKDLVVDKFGRPLVEKDDMFLGWVAFTILLFMIGLFQKRSLPFLTKALNPAGYALVIFSSLSIGISLAKSSGPVSPKGQTGPVAAYSGQKPDIFYIILDGFGRSDVIRREMGLNNDDLASGLRARGFYVADQAHSNYCQTELSITSSLNMDFLPKIVPGLSEHDNDRRILDERLDHNLVSQTLKVLGYRYVAVTSGFPAIHPDSADLQISERQAISLFASAVLARTPFGASALVRTSLFDQRREMIKSAIQEVGQLGAKTTSPRFIFAHILAPHPNFVFGPNEEAVRPKMHYAIVDGNHFYQNGGTPEEYRRGYAGQATAVGKMVLRAVDAILKQETSPPIILIQGDHGPKLHYDQEELKNTDLHEVFPILSAYLVPAKVREKLYPSISPVNSFRTVLREQFGQPLKNLGDRSWYSSWTWPFKLIEVTSKLH